MSGQKYTVIFEGRIAPGERTDQVKRKLAASFKADAAAVEKMFNGRKMVKRDLTAEQAARYGKLFESSGAVCRVEPPLQPKPAQYVIRRPQKTGEVETIPLARSPIPSPPPPNPSPDETPGPQFNATPEPPPDFDEGMKQSIKKETSMIAFGCGGLVVAAGVLTFLFGAFGMQSAGYYLPRFMAFGGLLIVGGSIWLAKVFKDYKEGK